ncbi:RNA polymerase sigma factor [Urbifossiella limnaea]|uniref:RNA polymerase sigma factor n=1 Tax=Urbifossiella limnaea TaxID=2528023 RepID=A0A517Y3C2_9BACT|nr:sigma-70 family RNA polymerase sigma factor [Urbifossiella limnaea]QDU24174.1 ECF RNA polymerase sigma factor SigE [Urbifossiella limnaea]
MSPHPEALRDFERQTATRGECAAACTPVNSNVLSVEEIYHRYATRVYSLAMRMLRSEADAEDVTQDVLLQVIRRLDTFRGDSTFDTWLYRVTVNAVLVLRRKRASARERQFGEDASETGHAETGRRGRPTARPEAEALDRERCRRVEAAIDQLPDGYRDPFILSDVQQLSNAEIGDILGLSIPAVKSRLHRARLMLRDALQDYFEERRTLGAQ